MKYLMHQPKAQLSKSLDIIYKLFKIENKNQNLNLDLLT